jgi:hypothetical protein
MDNGFRRPHQSQERYGRFGGHPDYRSHGSREEQFSRGDAYVEHQELPEKEDKEFATIVPRNGSYFEVGASCCHSPNTMLRN